VLDQESGWDSENWEDVEQSSNVLNTCLSSGLSTTTLSLWSLLCCHCFDLTVDTKDNHARGEDWNEVLSQPLNGDWNSFISSLLSKNLESINSEHIYEEHAFEHKAEEETKSNGVVIEHDEIVESTSCDKLQAEQEVECDKNPTEKFFSNFLFDNWEHIEKHLLEEINSCKY